MTGSLGAELEHGRADAPGRSATVAPTATNTVFEPRPRFRATCYEYRGLSPVSCRFPLASVSPPVSPAGFPPWPRFRVAPVSRIICPIQLEAKHVTLRLVLVPKE